MSEKKADGILEKKRTFKDYFMSIGPAIIIAAVVIGPGSVTTLSTMGAAYGYDPLWVIVFACFASYLYQEPAIRLVCERQMSVPRYSSINKNLGTAGLYFLRAASITLI